MIIDHMTVNLENEIVLSIVLPEGKTQVELIAMISEELKAEEVLHELYGRHVFLTGRLTTGMALHMGHKMAHVCKSVSIFDPKENDYVLAVSH